MGDETGTQIVVSRLPGETYTEARRSQHLRACVGLLPMQLIGCPVCDIEVWCFSNEVDWYKRNHAYIRHGAKW